MTRLFAAVVDGLLLAAVLLALSVVGVAVGFGVAHWVLAPFHDPAHMAHWPAIAAAAALALAAAMAVTSHHRNNP